MIHNVLAAARKALGVAPDAPAHGGGPLPLLHNATYMELALWIADQARPKLAPAVRKAHDEIVAIARPVRTHDQLSRKDFARLQKQMSPTGAYGAWELDPASATIIADGVALDACECHRHSNCGKGSRAAAIAAVKLLGAPFLDALDQQILRLDAVTMLQKQEIDPKGEVAATLWRGATGAKPTHWIVRLADERYGLLAKMKGRWTWIAGNRDEVLASVPDVHMESAIDAVLGSRGARPKGKKTAAQAEGAVLDGVVCGLAVADDGTTWIARANGELRTWPRGTAAPELVGKAEGKLKGVAAGHGEVVTFGERLTRWTGGRPKLLAPRHIDGAAILPDKKIVYWMSGSMLIEKKKIPIVAGASVFVAGEHIVAGPMIYDAAGEQILALPGRIFAFDGKTAAVADGKNVTLYAMDRTAIATCKLDQTDVNSVVLTKDLVLVGYHKRKRVAAFDRDGKPRGRVAVNELGGGIDWVYPLETGLVFAYGAFPHGQALLVDLESHALGKWRLGKAYLAQTWHFASRGKYMAYAHTCQGKTHLVRLG